MSKRSQNEPLAQLFGRRLRALREAKQLTQEQLVDVLAAGKLLAEAKASP